MSDFVVRLETDLLAEQTWRRLWDLDRQTEALPLTTVRLDPPATALAEGAGFTARTALGPVGFDDTMRVEEWWPPTTDEGGRATVVKTGRVIGGRIEVTVHPLRHGCRLEWRQSVHLPWLPARVRRLEQAAARLLRPGYRWAVRTLLGGDGRG